MDKAEKKKISFSKFWLALNVFQEIWTHYVIKTATDLGNLV